MTLSSYITNTFSMKISYLSTFYPFRGGIAQFNAALYREFEKKHNIKAFTFKRQYPDILFPGKSQMVSEDDKADSIPSLRILDTVNPFTYISSASAIKKYKPGLMLTKYWMPFFAPSLGWVCGSLKKNGTVCISILDNVIPHEKRPGDIAMTKYFLNRNNGFVVMSSQVKNDLLKLKPDSEYIECVHPLYSHFGEKISRDSARRELGIPPNKKALLFFGFIRSYKGLDILVETLGKMPDEYVLIIAGEIYGDFKDYEDQINRLQLQNRVYLHVRYIGDSEVPVFFSAADACILPYKSATQSGITGISYHFDLPVIATDVGGLREMIVPHNTGIMAEEAASGSLKTAIEKYFKGNTKKKLVQNVADYKKSFSWSSLAEEITDFYCHLKS